MVSKCSLTQSSNKDMATLTQNELDQNNIKRMCKMIKEGNVYKGYQQLDSMGVADLNQENYKLLKTKFIQSEYTLEKKIGIKSNIKLANEIIDEQICKLDTCSAAGTDGFSPAILLDFWKSRYKFPDLENLMKEFLQIVINGRVNNEITTLLSSCRLIPVIKQKANNKITDLRPICIPNTFMRLA